MVAVESIVAGQGSVEPGGKVRQFGGGVLQVRFGQTCQAGFDVLIGHIEQVAVDLLCHLIGKVQAAGAEVGHRVGCG